MYMVSCVLLTLCKIFKLWIVFHCAMKLLGKKHFFFINSSYKVVEKQIEMGVMFPVVIFETEWMNESFI